jgi:exonuclease III
LSYKRRADLEHPNHEVIWIEVYVPQKSIILCIVYRPENNTTEFWKYLNYSIENALDISDKLVVIGDLNVNLLLNTRSHLSDIIDTKNLRNIITEPTRVTRTTSTLIDPISDDIDARESGVIDFKQS